jgi:hypothetical protein
MTMTAAMTRRKWTTVSCRRARETLVGTAPAPPTVHLSQPTLTPHPAQTAMRTATTRRWTTP